MGKTGSQRIYPQLPSPNSHLLSVRLAAEFDKRPEEQADRRQQQPRLALEQFNNAPTDEESEQRERQDGQSKFHWRGV